MNVTIPDEGVTLGRGKHDPNDNGEYCFVEAWAFVRGLEWSDRPDCMSPVIAAFLRAWNDGLIDDDRNRLLVPLLERAFPRGPDDVEERRSFLALDWLVREFAPTFLRMVPALVEQADTLSALAPIVDMGSAIAVREAVRTAGAAAWDAVWVATGNAARTAAWAAAWAAARAAATAAARDASWAAAGDAAWAAAGTAARDAAWAAAGNAAEEAAVDAACVAAGDAAWASAGDSVWLAVRNAKWDAAGDVLRSTVETLQLSALRLIDRMEAVAA